MTKEEVLQQSTVDGNLIKLPDIVLDRKLYQEVAKALELIGGKWKTAKKGFLFNEDPTELLAEISTGEKRNLKKEFQFFATPDSLSDKLVKLSEVQIGQRILEPSAGQGAIINAINRVVPHILVDCFELMSVNRIFLEKIKTANLIGNDFLLDSTGLENTYDRIIANPPFAKNQDIDHVLKMYSLLKSGGRLVTIMSPHWIESNNKKERAFKDWLSTISYILEEIPAGTFKESGTNISTVIVSIYK